MKELLPQHKVTAGVVTGALYVLTLKILREKFGIEFTADEAVSLYIVIVAAVQWLVPNAKPPDESLPVPPEPPNAT